MTNQKSFSDMAYDQKKTTTRKDRFLGEMNEVLPWPVLLAPMEAHYPKPGGGRRPIGAEVMLRIYFMQQWYALSDPAMEDSLYDVESMRRFAGVDLSGVPDETTICKFGHFLEAHGLTEALFEQTRRYLSDRGLIVSEGSIVDATIIHAPSSTKNKDRKRDPEMASTKKGNAWHFGMKAHVGSDTKGRVHSVRTTAASVHDSQVMEACLHGREETIYADKAYADQGRKEQAEADDIEWRVLRKARRGKRLNCCDLSTARAIAPGRGSSTPSASSSICGVIARSGIAVWPRIPPSSSPCSPWPTSIWSAGN